MGEASPVRGMVRRPLAGWVSMAQRRLLGSRVWLRVRVASEGPKARAELLERLAAAASDPAVAGVFVDVAASPGGWAAVWDWREVLTALRQARRWVEAYVESPSEGTLALAAAANRITVPDGATVAVPGVGTIVQHQQAALDRLGLEVEVVAAGAYKSAGEPWSRRHPSPAAREALAGLLGDLSAQVDEVWAADRGIAADALQAARAAGWMSPAEARQRGLIDAVGDPASVRTSLRERVGAHAREVRLEVWARSDRLHRALAAREAPPTVAVVHLLGPIQAGEGGGGARIRSRPTTTALADLAHDDAVDAVVVHVDSPGGGVLPSQRIADAMARLARHKPVVASFADVAASGGVLLSTPATRILARPTTITGSIGVVGGKLVAQRALRKVGVSLEPIAGGPTLAAFSPARPFTDAERARFEQELSRVYDAFVGQVARGRGRSVDDLEPHCRGRVWTGRQGVEHGFVDGLGSLDDAVACAVTLAGADPEGGVRRRHIDPNHRSPLAALASMARSEESAVAGLAARVAAALGPLGTAVWAEPGRPLVVWPHGPLPLAP